ncbi:MAG: type II toxin-antitoxin system RelE/ParE family toxin [Gammaproteobacteria bacterium]|nr:type II toxin-antitoxin system RelE/ParE family toxin [Gammaproteobacteria bacterium]
MAVASRTVQEYVTAEGKIPFGNGFTLFAISVRVRKSAFGNFGDAKSIGDGVLELRIPYGPGCRVYFAREGSSTVILLLCGGDKSTQKRDISTAKGYWLDYQRRSS